MTGTVGPYYEDEEEEPMRNPISGALVPSAVYPERGTWPLGDTKPLCVMYCLRKGCQLTAYHKVGSWELSVARLQHIEDGLLSQMGPYCNIHTKEVQSDVNVTA